MPLPHFLALILAVTAAAGVTLWASVAAGLPLAVVAVVALVAAAVAHLMRHGAQGDDPRGHGQQ